MGWWRPTTRSREMFDTGRLAAVAAEGQSDGAALIERVLAELGRFTGPSWEQEDDLTLLTLERQEETNRDGRHPTMDVRSRLNR